MDTRLKAARQAHGWSQMRLVVELEQACEREGLPWPTRASLKVQVSRWENGHVTPDATHAALLAAIYRTTPADLGLGSQASTLWLPATTGNGTLSREYLATMEALLGEYARADNTVGPGHLMGVVGQHLAHLDSLLPSADHDLLSPALRLSSQYAEFAGWLSQDAGDLAEAQRWTDRALDCLAAEDDPAARSYVMMRKAGIAAERRDVVRSASLADAATRELDRLDPSLRALVLRQQAISHALTADERGSDMAGAAALEASTEYGPNVVKPYATPSYVLMETGVAAMRLKRLDVAVERLSQAMGEWPEGFHRDKGLCLARLGLAQVMNGDVDAGCGAATQAVDVALVAGSARTRAAFRTLERRLAPLRGATVVSEYLEYYSARLG